MQNYKTLPYQEKKDYVISLLESFASRWSNFAPLSRNIQEDTAYPEAQLDAIVAKFDYYRDASITEKMSAYKAQLDSLPHEKIFSDEELDAILQQLS